jgi:hypothetical protein
MSKMVSIYDPINDTYREVPLSIAKKAVEKAEETKVRVDQAKKEDKEAEEFNKFKAQK